MVASSTSGGACLGENMKIGKGRLGGKIGRSKRLIRFVPVRSPIVTRSRSNTMESAGNNSSAPPPPNMTEYASVTELNQVNEKLDRLTQMFMNFMQNQNQSNQDHPNYILVPDQPQAPPDQPQGQANPTGPSSSTNIRSLPPKQTVIFHTSGQQEDDTYEEEEWRSKGKQKADMSDQIAQLKSELRSELRSEVRQLKGVDTYGKIDLEDLCLHPGSKMPPKFKCPELSKYNGKGCPLAHLKLYIGSLSDFIDNEPLLLQLFQRSLTEEALDWYSTIDHTKLKVWRDLAEVFLDHFRFNTTDVANRMDVQRMYKKSTETFKQYAHRWRGVAARVKPPMTETEMVSTFISTLKQPYYGYLLGYYASNFATIVHIGDGIDDGIKTGKLADYEYLHNMFEQQTAANATTKRPVNGRRDNGKKEGDVQTVMVNRPQNSYAQPMYTQPSYPVYGQPPQPNYPVYAQLAQPAYAQAVQPAQPAVVPPIGLPGPGNRAPNQSNEKKYRVFTKLPVRPSELLPTLLEGQLIKLLEPKNGNGANSKFFNANEHCDFHMGAAGHSTDRCYPLKHAIQDLIDSNLLIFNPAPTTQNTNINQNPFPTHANNNASSSRTTNMIETEETGFDPSQLIAPAGAKIRVYFGKKKSFPAINVISNNPSRPAQSPTPHHPIPQFQHLSLNPTGPMTINTPPQPRPIIFNYPSPQPIAVNYHPQTHSTTIQGQSQSNPIIIQDNPRPRPIIFNYPSPTPIVINSLPKSEPITINTEPNPKPIVINTPKPFPFTDTRATPWNYDIRVSLVKAETIENEVAKVGNMTKAGRCHKSDEKEPRLWQDRFDGGQGNDGQRISTRKSHSSSSVSIYPNPVVMHETININEPTLLVSEASFEEDDWMNDEELMQQLFKEEQEREMEEFVMEAPPTMNQEDIPALDEEEEFLNQFPRSTDAEVLMVDYHRMVKVSDLIYPVKGNYELLNWEITPLTYEAACSSDTTAASKKKHLKSASMLTYSKADGFFYSSVISDRYDLSQLFQTNAVICPTLGHYGD
ncbi:hypothetical protein HHK36_004485 [Tetracentron sinense]|uniref:Retrotransposon gag domain-containing protein n=1 Tax=Tetracentron sinense TaxID=13715 RepID=A0A834ZT20_TETSI|nr:hypothetical protein HHK36_004485 [Tetracentron sinense]